MSNSAFVLKYTDDAGETHVTLHHSLEDAQTYRALIIANIVSNGISGVDDFASEVICDALLCGELERAYEEFMVWCDHNDDYSEVFFDIRETSLMVPTNMQDIFSALCGFDNNKDEVAVEVIIAKPSTPEKPTLRSQLDSVVSSLSVEGTGATLDDSFQPVMTESLTNDDYTELTSEELREMLLFTQNLPTPRYRVDGAHAQKAGAFVKHVIGDHAVHDLHPARTPAKLTRAYPEVTHSVKKT